MSEVALLDLHDQLCLEKYKIRLMKEVDRLAEDCKGDSGAFFSGINELLHLELGCSLSWIGDGFGAPLFAPGDGVELEEVPDGWVEERVVLHYYNDTDNVKCALYLRHRLDNGRNEVVCYGDSAARGGVLLRHAMMRGEELFGHTLAEILDTAGFDNYISQTTVRKQDLTSCVGSELANLIMVHGIDSPELRPRRKYMGYLFADICGYTSFAASNPSEVVMTTINRFLTQAVQIVMRHPNALIDKYVGDCVVILIGALENENAEAAHDSHHDVIYAREGVELARELMLSAKEQGFAMSSGFHLGEGHAGFVGWEGVEGSGDRLDFTAIGKNMNYAARLQDVAESGTLLVSGVVQSLLAEDDGVTFTRLKRTFKNLGEEVVYEIGWSADQ